MSTLSLESRIASSLVSDDIKSSDLAKLITETEDAIATADKAAEEERERALDPIASPDATKARETMQAAEFTRDRLKTVRPRLQKRHNELQELEYYAAWKADFERVEAQRDALAAEYAETYPQVVERLVDLLHRVEACDREASHINRMAPSGAGAHLRRVELTARGIEQLLQPDIEIHKELRLPNFKRSANEPLLAWPPQQPNLALQMPPDPFLVHEARKGTYIKEAHRRALEDNRRQIAEAEQRQREFEKAKGRRG
jgi:predicted transcriptional regulator